MPTSDDDDFPRTAQGTSLNELILTIFRLNGRLVGAGDALSRDLGLTSARWQVLGSIDDRPKTVAQIARHYELTRQGVLWVVQGMARDGLVELIRNPDHRRAKLVRQTETGNTLYREISRRQRRWVSDLAASYSTVELDTATALLTRISAMFVEDEEYV
jgi:DNA-binding MarR family transcriptional regulator